MTFLYLYHGRIERDKSGQNKTDEVIPKSYNEIQIFGEDEMNSTSNGVFMSSPFALGMTETIKTSTNMMNKPTLDPTELIDKTSLHMGRRHTINPHFQYTGLADGRVDEAYPNYGRVYAKTLKASSPLVYIQPGRPLFFGVANFLGTLGGGGQLKGESSKIRKALINYSKVGSVEGMQASDGFWAKALQEIQAEMGTTNNPARFYDFHEDWALFTKYLKGLTNELAIRLGLTSLYPNNYYNLLFGKRVTDPYSAKNPYNNKNEGTELESIKDYLPEEKQVQVTTEDDNGKTNTVTETIMESVNAGVKWMKKVFAGAAGAIDIETDILTQYLTLYKESDLASQQHTFLPFRVEKTSEASDSFDNSTGASSFSGMVKGMSDQVKEIQFLIKENAKKDSPVQAMVSGAANMLQTIMGTAVGGLSSVAGSVLETGGTILFPDVWKDSTYSRTINLNIKLFSPYSDKFSIFENLYFPVCCLMALAMPRQVDNAAYASPPLVKVFSKGWFNCDMGMITSLTIKRGGDKNSWSIENLARVIEVTVGIKDMFPTMMMSLSSSAKVGLFFERNTALVDYLNTLSGWGIFDAWDMKKRFERKQNQILLTWKQFLNPKTHIINFLGRPHGVFTGFIKTFFSDGSVG